MTSVETSLPTSVLAIRLKAQPLNSRIFSRILLIKPSALGDVVHTIPLLPKLRARFSEAQIDWLITPENADLVRHHPALSGVVLLERQNLSKFGRSWSATTELVQILRRLWRSRYELVIDLQGQLRSALFTLATGAPVRIGFDRPVSPARSECARRKHWSLLGYRWTGARDGSWIVYSHRIPIPTLDVHAVDRYLWIAPMLGLDVNPADSRIYLSADTEFGVKRLLEKHGLQRFAALVPGTKWETKHWGPERFAEVGRWLKEKYGFDVVILGTQNDSRRCEKVVKLCPGAIDFSGQTTAGELAAILKRAAVCVTNDSGSMHLAVALGRPVVSIFGPTNPMHIGPYGRPHAVVRTDLPCSPCNFRRLSQCPHGHACMDQVSAVTVIGRVECALGPVRRINL
ncbi:MAG: glycosyltransferase family 9 protein [Verrucomicrobia bacterium]|nr:glycosyltransferase family 9 protein [Verrucomicrobiota bacterium]